MLTLTNANHCSLSGSGHISTEKWIYTPPKSENHFSTLICQPLTKSSDERLLREASINQSHTKRVESCQKCMAPLPFVYGVPWWRVRWHSGYKSLWCAINCPKKVTHGHVMKGGYPLLHPLVRYSREESIHFLEVMCHPKKWVYPPPLDIRPIKGAWLHPLYVCAYCKMVQRIWIYESWHDAIICLQNK